MSKRASVKFLPEELIREIVSRLPSKPLIRFRYVSRSWYDMISKLVHSRKAQRMAVLYSGSIGSRDARLLVLDEDEHGKKAKIEDGIDLYAVLPCRDRPATGHARILGSYSSLLLLVLNSKEIFLLNPLTLQSKKVLDSPICIGGSRITAGFCYDSALDDYKVIITVPLPLIMPYVASFKRKTWKKIIVRCKRRRQIQWPHTSGLFTGTVVDEKIHWVVYSDGFLKILAFQPAEDSFVLMPAPKHPEYRDEKSTTILGVLDGCLALSSWKRHNHPAYIWVMKRYGVTSSWTKMFNIPETIDFVWNSLLLRPLFVTKQGKLLLAPVLCDKVVAYDTETKSYRYIDLPNKQTQIGSVITFEEGLSFPHDAYF